MPQLNFMDIYKLLPKTNCKECGLPTCMAFALALVKGEKHPKDCPPLLKPKYKQKLDLKPEDQAITANPDVYCFDYSDDIDFIIMGCDGIWEKKSNEEMVEYVYKKLNAKIEIKQIVSDLLLDTIAPSVAETQGIGCDNMTCIIIKFNK